MRLRGAAAESARGVVGRGAQVLARAPQTLGAPHTHHSKGINGRMLVGWERAA